MNNTKTCSIENLHGNKLNMQLAPEMILNKSVVYDTKTYKIIQIIDSENADTSKLNENHDFMPVELWNSSSNKTIFPTIKI